MSRVALSVGNSRSGCSAKDDGKTVMGDAYDGAGSRFQAKLGLDIPANWPNGQVVRPILSGHKSRPLVPASITRGDVMRPMGRLRWKMLALMLCGTIVIYVDRNVLGVLAPILKKDLNFSTEQYSYVVSAFQLVYSFSQPVAGYLTDLIGPRVGYAVAAVIWGAAAARPGDGMALDGGFPRRVGPQRSRRDPDGHESVDHLVSLAGAVDRDRLVQLRLLDRIDDHAAPRDLAGLGLWLAAGVPDHRHARRPPGDRLVLALSGSRGAPGPFCGRARLHHLRPGTPGGDQTLGRRDSVKDEVPRHHHRPFPDRAGLADLRVLDSPLHGQRAGHGHQAVRAVRLAAVPVLGHRLHLRRAISRRSFTTASGSRL